MQKPALLSNTYAVCLPDQRAAVRLDPFNYRPADFPKFIEIDYLAKAFQAAERAATVGGLTFYVTWSVRELPSYGDDVVAILMGDEWCRFPYYLGKVRAVFRSHANWPMYTGNLAHGVTYSNAIAGVQFLRLHFKGFPGRLSYLKRVLEGLPVATETHLIPLGYANQAALPVTPFADRTTDLVFMGSMNNELPSVYSPKYWLRSPKTVARTQMLRGAREFQARRPDLNVYLQGTAQFAGNALDNGPATENEKSRYSSLMMDAKVCLVPRGSSLETFRLFEAVRYGCVAICERLPERWYYEGLPAVQIGDWRELEGVLDHLFGDPERLERLHRDALDFWHTRCSEEVLGRFIVEQLIPATERPYRSSGWRKSGAA